MVFQIGSILIQNTTPVNIYITPKVEAVIPIVSIPQNSSKPIDSTGIERTVLVTAKIIGEEIERRQNTRMHKAY